MNNPSDVLAVRSKALYYLTLFVGFFSVIHFDSKIMAFLLPKLGSYIPYNWANILIGRFIEYALAIYIIPLLLAWIINMIKDR